MLQGSQSTDLPEGTADSANLAAIASATAFVAGPISMFLHEFAHWATGIALGYPPGLLAYWISSGVPDTAPVWQQAIGEAAGPFSEILICLAAYVSSRTRGSSPVAVGVVFSVGLRNVGLGLVAIGAAFDSSLRERFNPDEVNIALRYLGVPRFAVMAISAGVVLAVWVSTARLLSSDDRPSVLAACAAGIAGSLVYWFVLGPMILPW